MRYTVGKPVVFMKVVSTKGDDRFGSLYLPVVDTLQMVKMKSMICVEHHKVSDEWSDEEKYDGFIFHDPTDGTKWFNQYPTASYGQLDTSNDHKITIADMLNSEGELIDDNYDDQDVLWGWTQATTYINGINRALNPDNNGYVGGQDPTLFKALTEFRTDLITQLEQVSGKAVVIKAVVITYHKGKPEEVTKTVNAIWRTTLVE